MYKVDFIITSQLDENAPSKLILSHCEKCSLWFCLKEGHVTTYKRAHYSKILNYIW